MSERKDLADRGLGDLLRAHDPGAGASPLPPERARAMRRRILAEREAGDPPRDLSWLAAALAVLALGLALGPLWWGRAGSDRPAEEPREAAIAVGAAHSGREIQYTTERGTLVVWFLNPNFNLPEGN